MLSALPALHTAGATEKQQPLQGTVPFTGLMLPNTEVGGAGHAAPAAPASDVEMYNALASTLTNIPAAFAAAAEVNWTIALLFFLPTRIIAIVPWLAKSSLKVSSL